MRFGDITITTISEPLLTLSTWLYHYSQLGAAAMILSSSISIWRTGVLPKWACGLGILGILPLLHLWIPLPAAISTLVWVALIGLVMLVAAKKTTPAAIESRAGATSRVRPDMAVAALVFAALAALVHVYIWVLESLLWTAPRTRAAFGTSEEEAAADEAARAEPGLLQPVPGNRHRDRARLLRARLHAVGSALIFAGTGSMALAAVVLVASSPDKARGALIQGTFPVIAIVLLAVHLSR